MLVVDQERITAAQLRDMQDRFEAREPFGSGLRGFYALCSNDPLFVVAIVALMRRRGDSVLLLHGDTPRDTAVRLAVKAGCAGLFDQSIEGYAALPPSGDAGQGEPLIPSLFQYSSGTTGEPKLIGRPWEEIGAEIASYNERLRSRGLAGETPVVLASIAHSYGLIAGVLSAFERGVQPVVCGTKHPMAIVRRLAEHPNHLLYAVPALLQGLMPLFGRGGARLHAVVSSGAPMPIGLYEQLRQTGATLVQQYGCTEAGCVSLAIGMASHDDLGEALGHAELHATADPAELTVSAFGRGIATGDLGCMAAEGRARFLGRIDDLINVSGLKVMPAEVEEVLGRLPGIAEAVVYRGAHPASGETAVAMVVAKEGATVTSEQAREWCLRHLPPYKVPSAVRVVEFIPKMPSGKISRKLLAQGGA
ncbi:AMP-binding protein [Paenibacillus soyae]|uniref:AMP-binding protein n=1 Tax=Paenibacillus soyae TaxID=2969249 RepID=A0A9X2SBC6_9BACL|nr:AMP-binding protein [Paenibacillus soyae]MCR2807141.1 AMP-binding protein [Paenibacillus soyae]